MGLPTRAERPVVTTGLQAVEFGCMVLPWPCSDDLGNFDRIYGSVRLQIRAGYGAEAGG